MKKLTKLSLVAFTALSLGTSNAIADEIEISSNVALTSDYIWRGMTQNDKTAAVQGGFDLEYSNYYVGTWASNVKYGNSTLELDYYLGYSNEILGIEYDLNYCTFTYPGDSSLNFEETTLELTKSISDIDLGLSYSIGIDDATDNIEVSLSVMNIDLTYGNYDDFGTYYTVSTTKKIGKIDATLAYIGGLNADTDDANEDSKAVITISSSF